MIGAAALLTSPLVGDTIPVAKVVPDNFGEGRQPQVSVTRSGTIFVVFARDSSIYSVRSTDEGKSFSAPVKVAEVNHLKVGMRRGPRIAATDQRAVVTVPGTDLLSFVSEDMGGTWYAAGKVNDEPRASSEGLQNVTALPNGDFYAVWLDSRNGHAQIEGSRLEASTRSWSGNVRIYDSPDKTVCECCHPSVASDGKNKLTVMWRNWLGGNRDLYLAESADRGEHFSPAVKLGTGSWPLKACPMDGGGIVSNSAGTFAIWRRRQEIMLTTPLAPETRLGNGAQPVLARVNGRLFAVWQNGGDLVFKDINKDEVQRVPGGFPSLAASADGKHGYLVWESGQGNRIVPEFAVLQ